MKLSENRFTYRVSLASFICGIILLGSALGVQAFTGEKFAKDAKINIEQARDVALKAFPGKIVDEELEQGKGGSLRYSFDIVAGRARQEVWVDAKTGKVLRNAK